MVSRYRAVNQRLGTFKLSYKCSKVRIGYYIELFNIELI